jgi:hypothetical protein
MDIWLDAGAFLCKDAHIRGFTMSEYRLKIKIGEHEFEAEGPADAVQSQFQAFREIVSALPDRKSESINPESPAGGSTTNPQNFNPDSVFRSGGRVVSLTALPPSETDAVLMILFGQRFYRQNENVTGSEIIDGMEQSGYRTPRTDRILETLSGEGAVSISGAHRGKRYRLSNLGLRRAEGVVRETMSKLP